MWLNCGISCRHIPTHYRRSNLRLNQCVRDCYPKTLDIEDDTVGIEEDVMLPRKTVISSNHRFYFGCSWKRGSEHKSHRRANYRQLSILPMLCLVHPEDLPRSC